MKFLSFSLVSLQQLVSLVLLILSSTQLLGCATHKLNLDQAIQQLNAGCADDTTKNPVNASVAKQSLYSELDRHTSLSMMDKSIHAGHLSVDLLLLYEQELSHIKQLFSSTALKSGSHRKLKNKFYSKRIRAENRKSLLQITGSSQSHRDIAEKVLKHVQEHPVASIKHIQDFTDGNQIGFCFARAFLIHHLLHKEGVSPCEIYKIFAVGDLRVDHKMWHFHVAVVVRSISGPIVIDPFFEKPIPLHKWTSEMEKLDIKFPYPRTRFYVTDARKLLPASADIYTIDDFTNPLLAPYFEALSATIGPSSGVSP